MGPAMPKADRLACLARFAQWAVTRLALLCAADVLGGMPARLRSCHLAQCVRILGRRSFCPGRSSSSHRSGSWPDRRAPIRPPRSMTASPAWFAPVTPAIRLHTCMPKALPPVATRPWLSPTSPSHNAEYLPLTHEKPRTAPARRYSSSGVEELGPKLAPSRPGCEGWASLVVIVDHSSCAE